VRDKTVCPKCGNPKRRIAKRCLRCKLAHRDTTPPKCNDGGAGYWAMILSYNRDGRTPREHGITSNEYGLISSGGKTPVRQI
jgi:hypothetical protein